MFRASQGVEKMKSKKRLELYCVPLIIATIAFVISLFFRHNIAGLILGIVSIEGCALAWIAIKVGTAEIERIANSLVGKIVAQIQNKATKPDEE